MNLEEMKVADLRGYAEKVGIDVKGLKKKADIVAALKSGTSEAETIEGSDDGLAVRFAPATLDANFDALEARVDSILAKYEGWMPDSDSKEDVEQCARERKYLNGLAKQIDERRKAVKLEFTRPLAEFEGKANAIRDKVKAVSARISAVEKEADEKRREDRRRELEEHYVAYAGFFADAVPYEVFGDPRWLNKSFGVVKAKEAVEEKTEKAIDDLATIRKMGLEFADQAEAHFCKTLDLGGAVSLARQMAEDKVRLETRRREEGQLRREQAAAAGAPMAPDRAEPLPAPVPREPMRGVAAEIADVAGRFPEPVQKRLLDALKVAEQPSRVAGVPYVMCIDAADPTRLQALGKMCGLLDMTGTFKRGTVEEVALREREERANGS